VLGAHVFSQTTPPLDGFEIFFNSGLLSALGKLCFLGLFASSAQSGHNMDALAFFFAVRHCWCGAALVLFHHGVFCWAEHNQQKKKQQDSKRTNGVRANVLSF
jgi:hypothetical protein